MKTEKDAIALDELETIIKQLNGLLLDAKSAVGRMRPIINASEIELVKDHRYKMNFEEWKRWKEQQTQPTCDYVGCQRSPYWLLPQNKVYYCVAHAALIERMYGEKPIPF